jgi:hypothetical protein
MPNIAGRDAFVAKFRCNGFDGSNRILTNYRYQFQYICSIILSRIDGEKPMATVHEGLIYDHICAIYTREGAPPTIPQIMEACHLTEFQVRQVLRELRKRGWLKGRTPVQPMDGKLYA